MVMWATRQPQTTTAFVPTTTDVSTSGTNGCRLRNGRPIVLPSQRVLNIERRQRQTILTGKKSQKKSNTQLYFMGSDGGILGIGTPELFTILLVGYYVLGPSDLFKLTKEIGKFVQNFQTFAAEATTTFETSMESQLQLEEIRKAQRELNDAFSFRRSINVDDTSDPFTVTNQSPRTGDDITDMSTTSTVEAATDGAALADVDPSKKKKKKRIRRIKKKKAPVVSDEDNAIVPPSADNSQPQLANDIPSELDMTDAIDDEYAATEKRMMDSIYGGDVDDGSSTTGDDFAATADDDAAKAKKERLERLERGLANEKSSSVASEISTDYDVSVGQQQSRFEQQLSGNWNEQILAKNDELEPLAEVMNQLALLEEERMAADRRIQQEFKLREENEETFYTEKRKLLENAAAKIQASAYANDTNINSNSISNVDASKVTASSATAAAGAVKNDTKKI